MEDVFVLEFASLVLSELTREPLGCEQLVSANILSSLFSRMKNSLDPDVQKNCLQVTIRYLYINLFFLRETFELNGPEPWRAKALLSAINFHNFLVCLLAFESCQLEDKSRQCPLRVCLRSTVFWRS